MVVWPLWLLLPVSVIDPVPCLLNPRPPRPPLASVPLKVSAFAVLMITQRSTAAPLVIVPPPLMPVAVKSPLPATSAALRLIWRVPAATSSVPILVLASAPAPVEVKTSVPGPCLLKP